MNINWMKIYNWLQSAFWWATNWIWEKAINEEENDND